MCPNSACVSFCCWILFGIWIWNEFGNQSGTEFFAAYLVEKSLSVDNLFVFAIILTQFAVPSIYQQRVLLIGVVLALVLRAIFIAVGAAALAAFAFTFVIFGAILITKLIPNPNSKKDS